MEKVIDFPDRVTIEAEASAWIAQLDGDQAPSTQDIAALREWINRSPAHRAELERLAEIWGDLNIMTELAFSEEPRQPARSGFGAAFTPLRAGIAALLVLGIALLSIWFIPDQRVYVTAIGEQKIITLNDGSRVQLNTNSRLEVDFDETERKVSLQQGEAHFQVAHDTGWPFVVHAGTGLVRAVGTAFSVYFQRDQIEVTVTEGKVQLASLAAIEQTDNSGGRPVELAVLEAGQNTTFNSHHPVEPIRHFDQAEIQRKLSWRQGMLVFNGEPLQQVVEEVSRYTAVKIVITDPSVKDLRIGGYFKVGETDAMFEALESTFGVKVSRVDDQLVQLSSQ